VRVAGTKQAHQLVVLIWREALAGDREPAACAPERVIASAAVAEGLVLHAAPALIERLVGELHDVERIGDLDSVGEHRVEHRAIRRRQIERRPLDPRPPRRVSGGEPAARFDAVAARHHIEELATANVDDLRRPQLRAERADPREQCLVETERGDVADPVGVIDQLLTDRHDNIHHGVPAAPEIAGHLSDGASMATDLQRRPPCRAGRQRAACRGDLRVLVAPAAPAPGATPALLAPHQPCRAAEHRQVHEHDLANTVTMHCATAPTCRSLRVDRDDDAEPGRQVADTDHDDVGQADQQRAHARSTGLQAGAPRDSTT
jgi:hypothetical protein